MPTTAVLKTWDGVAWVSGTIVCYRDSGRWSINPLKVYVDGTWITVDCKVDNIPPVITVTEPVSDSVITSPTISYEFDKTFYIAYATFTRVGGAEDNNAPHVVQLWPPSGYGLYPGAHIGVLDPILIDSVVYNIDVSGISLHNIGSNNVSITNVMYNAASAIPVFDISRIGYRNNWNIPYSISKALASGSVRLNNSDEYNPVDPNAPYVFELVGSELNSGSHVDVAFVNLPGTLLEDIEYTIEFFGEDYLQQQAPAATAILAVSTTLPEVSLDVYNGIITPDNYYYNIVYSTPSDGIVSGRFIFEAQNFDDPQSPRIVNLVDIEMINNQDAPFTNGLNLQPDTWYYVTYEVVNWFGNTGTINYGPYWAVLYDVALPELTIQSPLNGSELSAAEPYVSFTVNKEFSIFNVTYDWVGGEEDLNAPYVDEMVTPYQSGSYTNQYLGGNPVPLVPGAYYSLTFNATDYSERSIDPIVIDSVLYT
jgi:hypothetical protein